MRVATGLREQGVHVHVVDAHALRMPLYGGRDPSPAQQASIRKLHRADGWVLATPVHNWGPSATAVNYLTHALDGDEMRHKPFLVVGAAGSIRSHMALHGLVGAISTETKGVHAGAPVLSSGTETGEEHADSAAALLARLVHSHAGAPKIAEEERDYAKEYREYHSRPEQVHKRSLRNQARAELGLHKGDPREADHKVPLSRGGSNARGNLRAVSREENRHKYNQVKHSSEPPMHYSLDPVYAGLRIATETLSAAGQTKEALSEGLLERARAKARHEILAIPAAFEDTVRTQGPLPPHVERNMGRGAGKAILRRVRQLRAVEEGLEHKRGKETLSPPKAKGEGVRWVQDTGLRARQEVAQAPSHGARSSLEHGMVTALHDEPPASARSAKHLVARGVHPIFAGTDPIAKSRRDRNHSRAFPETAPEVPPPPKPETQQKAPKVPPPPKPETQQKAPDTAPAHTSSHAPRTSSHAPHVAPPHTPHVGGHGWGGAAVAGLGGGLLAVHFMHNRSHRQ